MKMPGLRIDWEERAREATGISMLFFSVRRGCGLTFFVLLERFDWSIFTRRLAACGWSMHRENHDLWFPAP